MEFPIPKRITRSMASRLDDFPNELILILFEKLDLYSLFAVAEVCIRFENLAIVTFCKKIPKILSSDMICDPDTGKFSASKVRQLLYNFGYMLEEVTVDCDNVCSRNDFFKSLHLIGNYCVDVLNAVFLINIPKDDEEINIACLKLGRAINICGLDDHSKVNMTFNRDSNFIEAFTDD